MGMSNQEKRWYRDYGRRLRETRDLLGLIEAEAAKSHGVQLATYRRWEAGGKPRGKLAATIRFANRYGVSYPWLFEGVGPILVCRRADGRPS